MTRVRAADLPEGSIVVDPSEIFEALPANSGEPQRWRGRQNPEGRTAVMDYAVFVDDDYIDDTLSRGATVLRHGYGEKR